MSWIPSPTFASDADPYVLGSLPDFVSDIEWPIQPKIKKFAIVTNNAEFQRALRKSYRETTIKAGTYSGGNVVCNDCRFIFEPDALVEGGINFDGSRIHWVGGTVIGGPIKQRGAGDVLIDSLHARTLEGINNFGGPPKKAGFNRVAIINSTLESIGGYPSGWAFYVPRNINGGPFRGRNLILANVRLESNPGQTFRVNSIENLIVVDSYFNSNVTSSNGIRLHYSNTDVFFRDTIAVGATTVCCGTTPPDQVINGVFDNVTRFNPYLGAWSSGLGRKCQNVIIKNSMAYSAAGRNVDGTRVPNLGCATGTNPPVRVWKKPLADNVPDASGIGADH